MTRTVKVLKDGVEVVLDSANVAAEATLEAADTSSRRVSEGTLCLA
jgi:hypothetical protein